MESAWCFAMVNGRLAEIFFDKNNKNRQSKIFGHCYVKKEKYGTKQEKKRIEKDIEKYRLSYRTKTYTFLS